MKPALLVMLSVLPIVTLRVLPVVTLSILPIVILSGAGTSRSEVSAESKAPYSLQQAKCEFVAGGVH